MLVRALQCFATPIAILEYSAVLFQQCETADEERAAAPRAIPVRGSGATRFYGRPLSFAKALVSLACAR
jgi:hypothetical protein